MTDLEALITEVKGSDEPTKEHVDRFIALIQNQTAEEFTETLLTVHRLTYDHVHKCPMPVIKKLNRLLIEEPVYVQLCDAHARHYKQSPYGP